MSVQRVKDILKQHVTLTTEGIDRMYLNAYLPFLQTPEGVLSFFRRHLGGYRAGKRSGRGLET